VEAWQGMRVGDVVRLVALPHVWNQPDYSVPPETRDLWRQLIARGKALRVYEVDASGAPWVKCRVLSEQGCWEDHLLAITDADGWVRDKLP
jgi:hypothetical protein